MRAAAHSPGDVAEDAVQEAMIRAWRTWSRDGLPETPAAWLTTVTRREVSRWMSGTQGRTWRSAVGELRDGSADSQDELVRRLDVRSALRTLPEEDRLLLHLRYREGRTQAEIARLTGMAEGTAKVRLHRARAKLRGCMS